MSETKDQRDRLEREYSDWELFVRLLGYTRSHWIVFTTALVAMFLSTILSLVQPLILAVAIDDYIVPRNVDELDGLGLLALTYFLVGAVAFLLNVVSSYFTTITGVRLITRIRKEAFYKLQDLSMDFYDYEATGRIVSRITSDVERLLNLLSTGIIDAIVNSMFLGMLFFILVYLDVQLTVIMLIVLPILAAFIIYFRVKARVAWQKTRRTLAKVTGYYQEAISGIEVSKAFAAEDFMMNEFELLNIQNYEARMRALILFAVMFPVMDMILALGTALVLTVGGISIGAETLSVGVLVAFLSYLGRISQPIMMLSNFYNELLSSMAATERIFDIIDRTPSVIPKDNKKIQTIEGAIEFRDLTFAYSEETNPVISNFNINIAPNTMIALVGHTGAGKTTITNLLCRFYDFHEGKILLDGTDIRDFNLTNYRNNISIIPQDSFLFSGTIRDNLLYGKPSATDEELEQILLRVGAYDFVMEKGFDFQVGERGTRLSMGERQLLCFARAIISNPKILILDEATSSVDAHTELVIQQSMHRIIENRTAIIIAHRLSTVRSADRIVVLDQGKQAEEGTFQELLNKKGIFADLYEKQFAGQEI
ncbi:MAG: ABC transporter ATP-binding protein [Candidatus Heimdallarchaeota archaeon]|nr:MAG: ABC transporter ATP-binding protein [Candidatus Heimdallarchaeota archaeon]